MKESDWISLLKEEKEAEEFLMEMKANFAEQLLRDFWKNTCNDASDKN